MARIGSWPRKCYYLIIWAAPWGPLCGLWLGLSAQQHTFWLAAGGYLLYGLLLAGALRRVTDSRSQVLSSLGFCRHLAGVGAGSGLLLLTLGNVLTMSVYAHFQSTLISI